MNESGRHPVNVGHLVMGLAFLGLLVVWALVASDAVDGDELRWLMPVPWIVAGAAGLLASVVASRRRATREPATVPGGGTPAADTRGTDTDQEIS